MGHKYPYITVLLLKEELCDMRYVKRTTLSYQIADDNCKTTWVYNKTCKPIDYQWGSMENGKFISYGTCSTQTNSTHDCPNSSMYQKIKLKLKFLMAMKY